MKKLNIQPVAGYILVKPQKQEKTTASGILIPDSHHSEESLNALEMVGAMVEAAFGAGHYGLVAIRNLSHDGLVFIT